MNIMEQTETARDVQPKTLGLVRWVQMAFMAFALLLLWVFDKIITIIWDKFAEPQPTVVTLLAAVIGGGATYALYKNEKVARVANEVVGELERRDKRRDLGQ